MYRRQPRSLTRHTQGGLNLGDIYRTIKSTIIGRLRGQPALRQKLEKFGNKKIIKMEVGRDPVNKFLTYVLNKISFGQLQKSLKSHSYDDLYHLYIQVMLEDGSTWKLEKVSTIRLEQGARRLEEGGQRIWIGNIPEKNLTLNKLLEGAEKIQGDSLFQYNAYSNNCQKFVSDVLRAQGLLSPELDKFINQDVRSVLATSPFWSKILVDILPQIGHHLDVLRTGEGQASGGVRGYERSEGLALYHDFIRQQKLRGIPYREALELWHQYKRTLQPRETIELHPAPVKRRIQIKIKKPESESEDLQPSRNLRKELLDCEDENDELREEIRDLKEENIKLKQELQDVEDYLDRVENEKKLYSEHESDKRRYHQETEKERQRQEKLINEKIEKKKSKMSKDKFSDLFKISKEKNRPELESQGRERKSMKAEDRRQMRERERENTERNSMRSEESYQTRLPKSKFKVNIKPKKMSVKFKNL